MGSFGRKMRPKLPKTLNFSPHPFGCAKERPAIGKGLGGWVVDKSLFLDSPESLLFACGEPPHL